MFRRGLVLVLVACGNPPPVRVKPKPPVPPEVPSKIEVSRLPVSGNAKPEPILEIMTSELARSMAELGKHPDPPYWSAYTVTDSRDIYISAELGAVERSRETRKRELNVDVRIGTPVRDNTSGFPSAPHMFSNRDVALPIEDDDFALRAAIWLGSENAYYRAADTRGLQTLPPEDFSPAPKVEYFEAPAQVTLELPAWETRLRQLSLAFKRDRDLQGDVTLMSTVVTRYYANSDGTRYQVTRPDITLTIRVGFHFEEFHAREPSQLPSDEVLRARIATMIADAEALETAPVITEYDGPILFEGEAAAAFFHEAIGRAVEFRRYWSDNTFVKRIGSQVMPAFLDVYDDPTITAVNGRIVGGSYLIDDEGVRAERVSLVERGILKTMLCDRSPPNGLRSNGHARRGDYFPMSRQSNLVVTASRTIDREALRRTLLDEVIKQQRPFGLIVRRAFEGGFEDKKPLSTTVSIVPRLLYRVYPDGREELVRGGDIEVDRATSLMGIVAAGSDMATFDSVSDVSTTGPSIVVRRVKVGGR